jgi:CRISPR-associated endonuclease Cas3-HD
MVKGANLTMSGEAVERAEGGGAPEKAPQYVAHTPNRHGRWHELSKHLRDVAKMASAFASRFGAGELAYRAGLLHDVGKFSDEFQIYLQRCEQARCTDGPAPRKGVGHKSAGARMAREDRPGGAGDLLAYALFGHYGGLPSRRERRSLRPATIFAEAENGSISMADMHKCAVRGIRPGNGVADE